MEGVKALPLHTGQWRVWSLFRALLTAESTGVFRSGQGGEERTSEEAERATLVRRSFAPSCFILAKED